jgi:hypothetical protein
MRMNTASKSGLDFVEIGQHYTFAKTIVRDSGRPCGGCRS